MIRKRLTLSAAALMILMCSACNSSDAGTGETETGKSEIELSEESGDVPETDSFAGEELNENTDESAFYSEENNVQDSDSEYSQNIIDEAEYDS